jgi:diguanylate cyclase (GGDEF)-like protein/PAS domain S-box-containing protein
LTAASSFCYGFSFEGHTANRGNGATVETEDLRRRVAELEEELAALHASLDDVLAQANQASLECAITELELNQIVNTNPDGLCIVDENFQIQRINPALLQILGIRSEDAVGRPCRELIHGPACGTPRCSMMQILQGRERIVCDIEWRNPKGSITPFILTATPFRGLSGEIIGVVIALKDITERKRTESELQRANAELQRLACLDGLTQVANRRRFDEVLDQEWRRMGREKLPLSLILCDVDAFKSYNDTLGHLQGDDCLRVVAKTIAGCVRRPADFVARYGGEEFILVLPNTHAEGARHLAETIRAAVVGMQIAHPRSPAGPWVSISLGLSSVVPPADADASELVAAADHALYAAKSGGRNRVVYLPMEK